MAANDLRSKIPKIPKIPIVRMSRLSESAPRLSEIRKTGIDSE